MTEVLFDFLNLLLQLLLVALDNSWISEINNHKVLRKLSYIWIWSNQLAFRYAFSFRRHLITYFDVAILVFASYSPIMFLWQVHPVLIYTDFWIKMFVLLRIIFFYFDFFQIREFSWRKNTFGSFFRRIAVVFIFSWNVQKC